jgi:hypothetical protein
MKASKSPRSAIHSTATATLRTPPGRAPPTHLPTAAAQPKPHLQRTVLAAHYRLGLRAADTAGHETRARYQRRNPKDQAVSVCPGRVWMERPSLQLGTKTSGVTRMVRARSGRGCLGEDEIKGPGIGKEGFVLLSLLGLFGISQHWKAFSAAELGWSLRLDVGSNLVIVFEKSAPFLWKSVVGASRSPQGVWFRFGVTCYPYFSTFTIQARLERPGIVCLNGWCWKSIVTVTIASHANY